MRAAKVGRTGPDPAATSMRIFAVAALLCVVNIGLHFPGEMNPDSTGQYMEVLSGKYTDWHPPIMAAWWSVLRRIADGPVTMLVFHLVLHFLHFFANLLTCFINRYHKIEYKLVKNVKHQQFKYYS